MPKNRAFVQHKRKPPPKRKKNETPEERRERARGIRGSPLALDIEKRVKDRLKGQSE